MAITVTPGSQTSARLWISNTGSKAPLISTIRISGERCAPRTSIALAMPPRAIGVSENPSSSRHSCKLRSVSPSATKASSAALPAEVVAAARSIGAGTSRMLFTRWLLAKAHACQSLQLHRRNSTLSAPALSLFDVFLPDPVQHQNRRLLGDDLLFRRHHAAQRWRHVAR